MQTLNLKKTVICMVDSIFRLGLVSVLKELGHVVHLISSPNEIKREEHAYADYLIVGNDEGSPIFDRVLCFSERVEPRAIAVLIKLLKLSEVDRLKSVGVNAILSVDTKPAELSRVLVLLPEHWVVNTGILVPDGLASMCLTDREWEILGLLAQGNSVKEIARVLSLSVKTVEAHKFNMTRKLDIHNKAELVRWHIENKHLWRAKADAAS